MNLTASQALNLDRSAEIALCRLLHSLEPFMRAYPYDKNDTMPDHDITWVTGIGDDSVGKAVAKVLKAYPALWLQTLPEDVCVVQKSALKQVVGAYPHLLEHLERAGMAVVGREAACLQTEIEMRGRFS